MRTTMTRVPLPITPIYRLRARAVKARAGCTEGPDGWNKSDVDPMDLLAAFDALRICQGYTLRAYQFRQGGNGNGFLWAMKGDSPFPEPQDCPRLKDAFLEPPKPEAALDDFMEVIEGDGSPWSYLSASLFAREAREFGAMWHGVHWGVEEMLWKSPFEAGEADQDDRAWTWLAEPPRSWRPCCHFDFGAVYVSFYTYSGLGHDTIRLNIDEYQPGSYSFDTQVVEIADGPGGFCF